MHNDFEHEIEFWGDCTNTFGEDLKHYSYAARMGISHNGYWAFDVMNKRILDIGGGPSSMLLQTVNLKEGKVCDPINYPDWTKQRYKIKNISVEVIGGEYINESGWDEVWIYNCLQHTEDPQKIIENAKKSAKVLRIFEWINIPPHEGHPHMLTKQNLEKWIGQQGQTEFMNENNCVGECFYGVFYL